MKRRNFIPGTRTTIRKTGFLAVQVINGGKSKIVKIRTGEIRTNVLHCRVEYGAYKLK